ncbi:unnamed protein product [Leptosia nina]|uniref:GYF domain-containing protein n=1 Tax=Leptosia nina TaxID=320188 RepID=A0AAV1JYZ0_9NEOP
MICLSTSVISTCNLILSWQLLIWEVKLYFSFQFIQLIGVMGSGTPIKFGPEWLRNFGRSQSGGTNRQNNEGLGILQPNHGNQTNSPRNPVTGAALLNQNITNASGTPNIAGAASSGARQANAPRIFLANLRYGREEMLALYDRGAVPPEQLKYFDALYQPRGKPPSALNIFEDEQTITTEGARGGLAVIPTTTLGERNNNVRGRVAAASPSVKRPPFLRGWNRARMSGLNSVSPDDEPPSLRPWSTSNGVPSRTTQTEQPEAPTNKLFRNRRPVSNTNWRQSGREEGDEWRMQEGNDRRSANLEREWPERPTQDRQQSWGGRRWADNVMTDDIPEWANDSAEAGAGTFDASGAFHGYSNDDSNLPPRQQEAFPLTRSKTAEEGSEEWWASEKAKKLSPKRLLSSGFTKMEKPQNSEVSEAPAARKAVTFSNIHENTEKTETKPNVEAKSRTNPDTKNPFSESKTFDALLRSDIDMSKANDDCSNFKSVMIASNNSLRQKHQNIVASTSDVNQETQRHSTVFQRIPEACELKNENNTDNATIQSAEEKIVEEIFEMSLDDISSMPHGPSVGMCVPLPTVNPPIQLGIPMPGMQKHGIPLNVTLPNHMPSNIQNIGLQNSALNSSLGLPMTPTNPVMMPSQGVLPQAMPNTGINSVLNVALHQHMKVMGAYQRNVTMLPPSNVPDSSLFMGQNNNSQIPLPNGHPQAPDMQNNMFPMPGIQHSAPQQQPFGSVFRGVPPTQPAPNRTSLADLWYYEDPEKQIQGPFTSKEMWSWYKAGFFRPSLMVRRACETMMNSLASYGPIVPFVQLDVFRLSNYENRPQPEAASHQNTLGIGDSLWSQPPASQDVMWMQTPMNRSESRVNNLPMYFWDSQPSTLPSTNMLPEDILREMKTEEEILAQIRGHQNVPVSRMPFPKDTVNSTTTTNASEDVLKRASNDLSTLEKTLQQDSTRKQPSPVVEVATEKKQAEEAPTKPPVPLEPEQSEANTLKVPQPVVAKIQPEMKEPKLQKPKSDTSVKNNGNGTKTKTKKAKEEKKDEAIAVEEEPIKPTEKRSVESSPSKAQKDVKPASRKEIEKEKKELIKDGFTIVKGIEKNNNKENKKKAEEAKAAEDAERKRKEEEKLAAEDDRKRTLAAIIKKQQDQLQQKQAAESVAKKAPWSTVANQTVATSKEGLSLAEIQKLEREKKLEQIKEQQHMMNIIAQQQAAAVAREQEMQAGLGWAKKRNSNNIATSQPIDENQTKRQIAAAVMAVTGSALEKAQSVPVISNHAPSLPWGNNSNGGFWDCPNQLTKSEPVKMDSKPVDFNKNKIKAHPQPALTNKKETSPAMEFETWCAQALGTWSSKIDVPTFVGFLKDIESPYEVKDYVKYYLGESKDSSDFSRQFLERRSKLLRVGTVTPSDDLCSPAMAINPRTTSLSDYQEVKGKGKKAKKNKMMKVDARILGFSVTAAEDRINVGDIDTA